MTPQDYLFVVGCIAAALVVACVAASIVELAGASRLSTWLRLPRIEDDER